MHIVNLFVFEDILNSFLQNIDRELKELKKERDDREKFDALVKANIEKTREQITFNIGGKIFSTTKTTLMKQENYFYGLLRSGSFLVRLFQYTKSCNKL